MTKRNCHTFIYSYFNLKMARAGFSPRFPLRPLCLTPPDSSGRLREAPGQACRNYRPKPAPTAPPSPDDGLRQIPLSRGQFALVDAADYE
jgi:hypothetical protein